MKWEQSFEKKSDFTKKETITPADQNRGGGGRCFVQTLGTRHMGCRVDHR